VATGRPRPQETCGARIDGGLKTARENQSQPAPYNRDDTMAAIIENADALYLAILHLNRFNT
jgi:hypothetical protein